MLADLSDLASLVIEKHERESTEDSEAKNSEKPYKGTATFIDGHVYRGSFLNGFMDGQGEYQWADGVHYVGEFKKNKIEGKGVYAWNNGSKFDGDVKNSMRHGQGVFTLGEKNYSGEWKDGLFHGYGILKYDREGKCFYEGQWESGNKHGKGVMKYASGHIYSGQWKENTKCGEGTMKWADRKEEYSGAWYNNQMHGYGTYTWKIHASKKHQFPECNRYEGHWVDGKRNGYGTYHYASGAVYQGEWKDDQKEGHGVYAAENGRRYVGLWDKDRMVDEFREFNQECPYYFYFDDLLHSSTPEDIYYELKHVNQVILRNKNLLRPIYQHYCDQDLIHTSRVERTIMTRAHLWKLLRDSKIPIQGWSMPELDRAVAAAYKGDKINESRFNRPHDMSETFIFHSFLEALIRVAYYIYGKELQSDIAASFTKLIKSDLSPHFATLEEQIGKPVDKLQTFKDELNKELAVKFCLKSQELYQSYAKQSSKSAGSPDDRTITIRDFIYIIKDSKVLDYGKGPLTILKVIGIFAAKTPQISDGNFFNLEYELASTEFFENLLLCSHIKVEEKMNRIIKPLLNSEKIVNFNYDMLLDTTDDAIKEEQRSDPHESEAKVSTKEVMTKLKLVKDEKGSRGNLSRNGKEEKYGLGKLLPKELSTSLHEDSKLIDTPLAKPTASRGKERTKTISEKTKDKKEDKEKEKEKDKDKEQREKELRTVRGPDVTASRESESHLGSSHFGSEPKLNESDGVNGTINGRKFDGATMSSADWTQALTMVQGKVKEHMQKFFLQVLKIDGNE